jgi:ribonuclease HI
VRETDHLTTDYINPDHVIELNIPPSDKTDLIPSTVNKRRKRRPSAIGPRKKAKKPISGPSPLPAPPPAPAVSPHLKLLRSSWPEVELVYEHVYLGTPFGPYVTPDTAYAKPMEKLEKRCVLFRRALKPMSVQNRIVVVNVFILPLLSFVNQFFLMPDSIYKRVRALIKRCTTPYHGSAWPYCQLVAPLSEIGFRTPVRDPWIENVVALLRNVDWANFTKRDLPWNLDGVEDFDRLKDGAWHNSPAILDNVHVAVMDFLGPNYYDWNMVTPLPIFKNAAIRKLLIRGYLRYPWETEKDYRFFVKEFGVDMRSHIENRLKKFGLNGHEDALRHHYKLLPRHTPAHLITNHIKILTNALATARRRDFGGGLADWGLLPTCLLCGSEDDGVLHLFHTCMVVKRALVIVTESSCRAGIPAAAALALRTHSHPLFLPPSYFIDQRSFSTLGFIMAFCKAVVNTVDRLSKHITLLDAAEHISFLTCQLTGCWSPARAASFGNASNRTEAQKLKANSYAKDLLATIPPCCVVCYTDGSAIPNPGPAGAGAVLQVPGQASAHLYASIGQGTNNLGEAWAIGMTLKHFFNLSHYYAHKFIVILTDSELCIRAIRNGFSSNDALNVLVQGILSLLRQHPDHYIKLFWVPGHVDVEGNIKADNLAGRGACVRPIPVRPALFSSDLLHPYRTLLNHDDIRNFFHGGE